MPMWCAKSGFWAPNYKCIDSCLILVPKMNNQLYEKYGAQGIHFGHQSVGGVFSLVYKLILGA